MLAETIERTHTRQAAQAASRSSFLQETATKVKTAAEQAAKDGTRAGGREQLKGHFIERLDVTTYNAKNKLTGKVLDPRPNGVNPAYDASRYIDGKFAGGIQQKSSAGGTEKAIPQIEKVKPGSASRATLRVPKDHERAHGLAGVRIDGRVVAGSGGGGHDGAPAVGSSTDVSRRPPASPPATPGSRRASPAASRASRPRG